jgi:hypothetical protein
MNYAVLERIFNKKMGVYYPFAIVEGKPGA